jgi:hypothetical protein
MWQALPAAILIGVITNGPAEPPVASRPAVIPKAAYFLPSPITSGDIRAWSGWLSLAAPQTVLLEDAHLEYSRRWNADAQRMQSEIEVLAERVGGLSLHGASAEMAAAVADLREHEQRCSATLLAHDNSLFAALDGMLADVQKDHLSAVRHARDRDIGKAQPFFIAAARIDLTRLTEQVELTDGIALGLEPILREYDAKVAPMLLALRHARWTQSARAERLTADMAAASARHDTALVESLLDERSRLLRSLTRLERRIADINQEFGARVEASLPPPYREHWQAAYDSRAYPSLFPDRGDPADLLTEITNVADLDVETLTAVRNVFARYITNRDAINRDLRTAQDQTDDAFASTLTSAAFDAGDPRVNDLRAKRRNAQRTVLDQTEENLPQPVREQFAARLAAARRRLEPRRVAGFRQTLARPARRMARGGR